MEIRERNGFVARKDNRGRNLRTGESQRKDGLYMYRYKDERTGRRLAVYSPDLAELRKKEKEIEKDQSEGIMTDTQCKNMTLNDLFEIHMDTRKLAESTQANYRRMWNSLVRNELGQMKVVQVRPSHVRLFYSRLSKQKYSHSTIKFLHNMILPSFEVAVDDDIIRKNPAKRALGDYGEPEKKRTALSFDQQKNLLNYVKNSEVFHIYLPLLQESAELCKEQRGIPYLSATFAGDDWNRTPLWGADRTHLEGRGSEDPDRIRESSADL